MLQCASHCFPIENAFRQEFMHMIARPAIYKDNKRTENNLRNHGCTKPTTPKGARQKNPKNLAFLAEHSAKALTPPTC